MARLKQSFLVICYLVLNPFNFIQSGPIRLQKKYTLLVFMAADNNLARFALHILEQMLTAGSNENINILVQINTPGKQKSTERYFIEKGKKNLITSIGQAPTQKLNSGDPQTLIDAATWAMKYYPAENLILNLWSHGSGIYDPTRLKNNKFNDEHIELSNDENSIYQFDQRGICFDDTHKSYMTNQGIKFALQEIQHKVLRGKKIAVLWLEACLMSMIEVTSIFKDHVEYLVSSENVEYAPGSNYPLVLSLFAQSKVPSSQDIACHIVHSFKQTYSSTKLNFTQSAINLSKTGALEANINLLAEQLILALQDQKNKSVTTLLKKCKSRPLCTCFHEPSFIDLRNFYMNLQSNIGQISLMDTKKEVLTRLTLLRLIDQGIYLMNNAIIANTAGNNVKDAHGLSIYFPEVGIFNSYLQCNFSQSNNWSKMLIQYILSSK